MNLRNGSHEQHKLLPSSLSTRDAMVSRIALILVAFAAVAHATYDVRRISSRHTGPLETETLPEAQYSVPFSQKVPRASVKNDMLTAVTGLNRRGSGFVAPLSDTGARTWEQVYVADVNIGGQDFQLLVDTGS